MMADLEGKSLDEVLRLLERGRIGHRDAMDFIRTDSLEHLYQTMRLNGRLMPGHQPMQMTRAAYDLLASVFDSDVAQAR